MARRAFVVTIFRKSLDIAVPPAFVRAMRARIPPEAPRSSVAAGQQNGRPPALVGEASASAQFGSVPDAGGRPPLPARSPLIFSNVILRNQAHFLDSKARKDGVLNRIYKDFPQSQGELFGFCLFFLDQRLFGEFGVAFD